MKKYTLKDLERIKKEWNKVYNEMEKEANIQAGSKKHLALIKKEKLINKMELEIRQNLYFQGYENVYAEDPCPLSNRKDMNCSKCSGYFKNTTSVMVEMCKKEDKGAKHCINGFTMLDLINWVKSEQLGF